MSHKIYIGSSHPLSRYYVHPSMAMNGAYVGSIERAYYEIMLFQHNRPDLLTKLTNNAQIFYRPETLASWCASNGFRISNEWLYRAPSVYEDIILDQLRQPDTIYGREFKETIKQVPVSDRAFCRFIVTTSSKEFLWSCGLREDVARKTFGYPGKNKYGDILEDVKKQYLARRFVPRWGVEELQQRNLSSPLSMPTFSVIIMSDSMLRQISKVQNGLCYSLSGAKYHNLVDYVFDHNVRIWDCDMLVIQCGTTLVNLVDSGRKASWRKMERMLVDLKSRPKTPIILVSTAVPHPRIRLEEHSRWVEERLNGLGILCCNWSERAYNPFQHREMFDMDDFHLSHAGVRCLWDAWCEYLPNLEKVPYSLGRERYPNLPARK